MKKCIKDICNCKTEKELENVLLRYLNKYRQMDSNYGDSMYNLCEAYAEMQVYEIRNKEVLA